jgi:hypothetical protein
VQTGCQQDPAGYICSFTVKVDYSNASQGSRVEGSITGTASAPGVASQTKTVYFGLPADPGSSSVSEILQVLFALNPCVETSTAAGATTRPNPVNSQQVAFGRTCAPPPFQVTQVSLVPSGPPSQAGCLAGTVGYSCDFTLQVDYANAPPGATVGGSVTGMGSQPGGLPETSTTTFSISVNPSAGSVTAPVRLFFTRNPCVEASTAYAQTDQPNAVSSPAVAFGNVCARLTVNRVTLTADDPSQTGCQPGPAGYVCSFTVVVEYVNARSGDQISGSLSGTDAPPQVPPLTSTEAFKIQADPSTGSGSTTVRLVFPTNPCVQDSSGTATTDQPNAVKSLPVRFGSTCTPG